MSADSILSPQKAALVAALSSGMNATVAARQVGVCKRTAARWLADPAVQDALQDASTQAMATLQRRLTAIGDGALLTLESVMSDPHAPANARVSAARAVIDSLLRVRELVTLEERLIALEAAVNARN